MPQSVVADADKIKPFSVQRRIDVPEEMEADKVGRAVRSEPEIGEAKEVSQGCALLCLCDTPFIPQSPAL
jgi:hypothetical protein